MRAYLIILPVALLVTYSQIVVKWRVNKLPLTSSTAASVLDRIFVYVGDPVILSAYLSALLASFAWLFVVTKLPLTTAFPIYIGITFGMVLIGGWLFLAETMTLTRFAAILLIFSGIIIGIKE